MKFFNTAGPVNRPNHYKIDPLTRWDFNEVMGLIRAEKYFILHAPRQTGKTSCLLALRDYLNGSGEYFTLYINVEAGQALRHDVDKVIRIIVAIIRDSLIEMEVSGEITDNVMKLCAETEAGAVIISTLAYISSVIDKPVVLFIDEIDALIGDSLVSVLRQLRSGYAKRPGGFPSTVVLCGIRDIKDYRIHTSGKEIITGGSAFNIKAKSLRLGDFSKQDVINLYSQHTFETGQRFDEGCFDLVMEYTGGQPWLVNALAYTAVYEMKGNRDPSVTITPEILAEAKELLILERQTHLDQLVDKLGEDRVRSVVAPMILGEDAGLSPKDVEYCIDLGLIKRDREGIRIANKIYQEIIPRELTSTTQDLFNSKFSPDWIGSDGSIDMAVLLTMFRNFWNENREIWGTTTEGYKEAAPHLILQAFLQRVVNGGGTIEREYAIGRQRVDLMIKRWYGYGDRRHHQHIVLELKTIHRHRKYQAVLAEGLKQTARYASMYGKSDAYLLIFDKDDAQGWQPDEPCETHVEDGISIEVWKFRQSLLACRQAQHGDDGEIGDIRRTGEKM